MKICSACQAANTQEANFCSLCRAPFERTSRSAYCPRGHAMHPSWPECLECKGERSMVQDFGSVPPRMPTLMEDHGSGPAPRGATVLENFAEPQPIAIPIPPPAPPLPVPPRADRSSGPSPTATTEGINATAPFGHQTPPVTSRRVTQYVPATVPAPSPSGQPAVQISGQPASPEKHSGRRIVGMLLTFTWRPEGQIYPVREGRNLIGRSPDCDIAIPEDPHLSERNSHITYRRSFTIGDMVSMSGTDLNGEPVEENYVKLPNYAKIRAGSTHFTFIGAEPPATENIPAPL